MGFYESENDKKEKLIKEFGVLHMCESIFDYALQYSSNDISDNIFQIYLDKLKIVYPGAKVLVATVTSDNNTKFLPHPDFYGKLLKMDFESIPYGDLTITNIYIYNANGVDTPTYIYDNRYDSRKIFTYLGNYLPVYGVENKVIALGIKATIPFNLEGLYTTAFSYETYIESLRTLEPLMKTFEDYKKWIDIVNTKDKIETCTKQKILLR